MSMVRQPASVARPSASSGIRWLSHRLAWRELAARPRRTVLIVALIGLPVTLAMTGLVLASTATLSDDAAWEMAAGQADVVVRDFPESGLDEHLAQLPGGSRTAEYVELQMVVASAKAARVIATVRTDAGELGQGQLTIVEGTLPGIAGEVALSPAAADALGTKLGETFVLERPLIGAVTVVGLVEQRHDWGGALMVVAPNSGMDWSAASRWVLIDLPAGADPFELTESWHVATYVSPSLGGQLPSSEETSQGPSWLWLGGLLAMVVGAVVASAAFAAGARRQLSVMGRLAATGAEPRVLRRVLVAQGLAFGVVSAVAGTALASVTLIVMVPSLNQVLGRDVDGLIVPWIPLLTIALAAILLSGAAAWRPARTASRVTVLEALAGRRPDPSTPRWIGVAGLGAFVVGVVAVGIAMAGGTGAESLGAWGVLGGLGAVAVVVGACMLSPMAVQAWEPFAVRSRGPARLALRGLLRQRSRSASVVTTVCATVLLVVAIASLYQSGTAKAQAQEEKKLPAHAVVIGAYGDSVDQATAAPAVAERVAQRLDATVVPVWRAVPGSGYSLSIDSGSLEDSPPSWLGVESITVATSDVLDLLDVGTEGRALLGQGRPIVLGDRSGPATLMFGSAIVGVQPLEPIRIDAVAEGRYLAAGMSPVLVPLDTLQKWGWDITSVMAVILPSKPLTGAEQAWLMQVQEDLELGLSEGDVYVNIWWSVSGDLSNLQLALGGLVLAMAVTLVAVLASLALASAESRDEQGVIAALGASPRVLVTADAVKALVLVLTGVVVAIPAALAPVLMFSLSNDRALGFEVPWLTLAGVLVVLPLVAAGASAVAAGLRARWLPVEAGLASAD